MKIISINRLLRVGSTLNLKPLDMKTNTNELTPREEQVLKVATKHSNDSRTVKAERLRISEHTFNNHMRRVFYKLKTNREVGAIKWYIAKQLRTLGSRYGISHKFFTHINYMIGI